jgi:NADH-quinone oxidoreductase subunit L
MHLLLVGLIANPLLVGACVLAIGRRIRPTIARAATMASAGVVVLCALALLPYAGQDPGIASEWLPGMGVMTIEFGATGLYAALAMAGAAFLSLLGGSHIDTARAPAADAALLLALPAALVALVAGHFLLRYAALEVAALCVAWMPLVERQLDSGTRNSRTVYLILRMGDAGLLIAIMILMATGGTLEIGPALQAGASLTGAPLNWVAAGVVTAVWIEVGGWPFHVWTQVGQQLSSHSHAWLYATVLPNLGLYLLYRMAPLLARAGPIQFAAQWIGAGGAAIAALLAVTQADMQSELTYIGAALGSLALLAGSSGLSTVVWLSVLIVTPVRLLLHLAAELPLQAKMRPALLFLGGIALTIWSAWAMHWTREAGAPLDILFVAEAGVALLGVWTVSTVGRSLAACRNVQASSTRATHWTHWTVLALLGTGVLTTGLAFGPALQRLTHIGHGQLPSDPTLVSLLQYLVSAPGIWTVTILASGMRLLRWQPVASPAPLSEQVLDLDEGLARIAQTLREMVKVGRHEQIIALVIRSVVGGARLTHRIVERGFLEGALQGLARAVAGGGRLAYRTIEQEGLEGLLRRIVKLVLALARIAQGWHTGRLRRNLLWVATSLVLAVLLVFVCW